MGREEPRMERSEVGRPGRAAPPWSLAALTQRGYSFIFGPHWALQEGGERTEAAGGWTDVQLKPPHYYHDEGKVEEREAAGEGDLEYPGDQDALENDVGSFLRGGITNFFQSGKEKECERKGEEQGGGRKEQAVQTEPAPAPDVLHMQETINRLTAHNEILSNDVARLMQAAADLEAQVIVSQDVNANLSTGLEELDIQHQRAIESIMVVKDETLKEYEVMKVKFKEMEDELALMQVKESEWKSKKREGREEELIRELEERNQEVECLEGENASLRETVKEMNAQLEKNKESLPPINEHDAEEVEALQRQIEELSAENTRTNTDLKQSQSRTEFLQKNVDRLNQRVSKSEEKNDQLSTLLTKTEAKLVESSDHMDNLRRECESKDRKMCQILLESNAVEQECKAKLESQEVRCKELTEELSLLKENLALLKNKEAENQRMVEMNKISSEEEQGKNILVEKLTEENEKLVSECNRLVTEKENVSKGILDAEAKISCLIRDNKTLEEKINTLNSEKDIEMTKYRDVENELFNLKSQFSILEGDYKSEIRDLQTEVDKLRVSSEQYLIDKEVFQQKEMEMKNQLISKENEIEAYKSIEFQNEMVRNDKVLHLEKQLECCISEKDLAFKRLNQLEEEITSLNISLVNKDKDLEEYQNSKDYEIKIAQDKILSLEEKKTSLETEMSSLQLKVEELSSQSINSEEYEKDRVSYLRKIESITDQNVQLLADIVRLNSEHSSEKKDLVSSHSREISSLQEKLQKAENELQILQSRYDSEVSDLRNKLAQVESEGTELLRSIQMKHDESLSYQSEVLRLNEVVKTEKSKLDNLVVEKAHLEMKCQKIPALDKQVKKYEESDGVKSKELASLRQEVENLKDQLGYASELLKETKRQEAEGQCEDPSANKTCPNGCSQTQEELNKLTWSLHAEQGNTKTLQRQVSEYKDKLEKSESQLSCLQKHLMDLERSQTEEQVQNRDEMKQLMTKLEQAEERARASSTAYTSASIRANQQVESLSQQIRNLTEQKERLETELSKAEDSALKQQAAVTNLQAVLHQFQIDKQKDIEFETERLSQKLNDSYGKNQELVAEIKLVTEQLENAKMGLSAASRLSEQLDRKLDTIETLNNEVLILKEKLRKEEEKVCAAYSSVEGKVDRNLIKNLLVGFMCAPVKNKDQVLKVISSVLDMDLDDRRKLGIEPISAQEQQSLSLAFIKFLENESQPKPHLVLTLPETPEGPSRRTSQSSSSSVLLSDTLPNLPFFPLRSGSILKDVLKDSNNT